MKYIVIITFFFYLKGYSQSMISIDIAGEDKPDISLYIFIKDSIHSNLICPINLNNDFIIPKEIIGVDFIYAISFDNYVIFEESSRIFYEGQYAGMTIDLEPTKDDLYFLDPEDDLNDFIYLMVHNLTGNGTWSYLEKKEAKKNRKKLKKMVKELSSH